MNEQVLLLGNGINNVGKVYSWGDLINDLIAFVGLTDLDIADKPFPLLYEEIFLSNLRYQRKPEEELKEFISEKIKNIKPTSLHEKVATWGFQNIITTNYDYTIENAYGVANSKLTNRAEVKENLYSIFRHTRVNDTRLWHIHGEINVPRTILLGFEHYSGQLQQIRNYVATGTGRSYKAQFIPLVSRLKDGIIEYDSWLDLFFTQDIYILGLKLDYVESDLWWLFTYRARIKFENRSVINNSIFYYYPAMFKPQIKAKLDLLCTTDITCIPINDTPDEESYYYKVFDAMKGNV